MAASANVFLFGDETYDFVPNLRDLLKTQDNPILTAFLDQSHYVVRAQMMKSLPPAAHKLCRTSDLGQMLRKYVDGKLPSSFQTALYCITQLGCFMRDHQSWEIPYPQADDSYMLGVCTGALAAAAVSCSNSLSQLLPLAVQTVLIAFRFGLCITERRDSLECSEADATRPWSVVLPVRHELVTDAMNELCRTCIVPDPHRPWITTTARESTTVSGPPSLLDKLLQMPAFQGRRARSIPIYVPAHNSNLFTIEDIQEILGPVSAAACMSSAKKLPFISSVSGHVVTVPDYRALVEVTLRQILLQPICWDIVEQEVPGLLKQLGKTLVRIVPVNSSAQALRSALEKHFETVQVDQYQVPRPEIWTHRPGNLKGKLAIVSMSGRFPESPSTETFWELLSKGLDVVKEVPIRRWDVATHVDSSGKIRNKGATKWGCWLDFYDEFDPKFFSISPKEAPQIDPAQRMALMSTYEAMERGGIVPDTTPSTQRNRIGVFHGVTSNDWMEVNTAQNIDTYFITGGNRGFIPGRINFCFEFSGPSYANDTACSSSLAAIHLACNSLWRGDCDTAVAGATNMIFNVEGHTGLDKGFFLSRTGNCKPFDDGADGYCRAEGVGTVFIKRLEDAIADKDPIIGTILAVKTNHSAMSDSITRPLAEAQIDNMSATLDAACIDSNSLSYIEMHGTGTQVGDAEEMKSVLACFAPNETFRGDNPLWLGSAKANIGHGEGVSGITSLIKVLLMMKHDTIPPHCGIKSGSKINRTFPDLTARNVHIAFQPTSWPRKDKPRRALINNFSAAGGNTALLVEDAPSLPDPTGLDPRRSHIVAVSGHTGKSLTSNLEMLLAHCQKNEPPVEHLSYTTTARRWHHIHRVAIAGSSIDEIRKGLQNAILNGDGIHRPKSKPNVVFAFTGQASQYFGMGRQLYNDCPAFKNDLQRLNRLAQSHGFPSFSDIYTSEHTAPIDALGPVQVQLAILCLQIALGDLMRSFGVLPTAVVGHSLGEYAALHFSGILSASDALYLVGKRAKLLQRTCQPGSHAMLSTKMDAGAIQDIIQKTNCEIACINGPRNTVISGPVDDIAAAQRELAARGIKSVLLELPFAFHSAQVDPFLEEFMEVSRGATFLKPKIPLLSPLTGEIIDTEGIISPSYLARHCRKRVDMVAALEKGKSEALIRDNTIIIEVGPKPLLYDMIKSTLGQKITVLPTLTTQGNTWRNIQAVLSTLYTAGLDVNWVAYHAPFKSSHKVIDLPSYGWDLKSYDIPYEGDWALHKHKIHCNCAEGDQQWETSSYVPGKHTFAGNIVMPNGEMATSCESHKRISKLDPNAEAYPIIEATTTLHKVIKEETQPLGATIVVETDLSRKDVNGIAKGHLVDSIPLATPSFFSDIAMQLGRYAMNRIRAGHAGALDGIVDVSDLVVDKALIPHGQGPQLLRTTLTLTWPPKAAATTRTGKVNFETYFADGKLDTAHASCTVRFATESQLKSLRKKVPEYRAAIWKLHARIGKGELVKYTTKSGYKLMSAIATFHSDYKLLDSVILNQQENEACCVLRLENCQDSGTYAAHPAYLDALTQLSGFTMNASDETDLDQEVFVTHGWGSLQIYQELQKGKSYEVYTKMTRDKTGDLVHGDTIVLDGEEVVAFIKDLSLRNVSRKVFKVVLETASSRATRQVRGASSTVAKLPLSVASSAATQASPVQLTNGTHANDTSIDTPVARQPEDELFEVALKIIAEESGVAEDDFTEDTVFADAGIDSLSSLVICSRLREELAFDLDPDFSLFTSISTVGELRTFLGGGSPPEVDNELPLKLEPYCRPTNSVILQGIPKFARRTLFLLPDGSGSASSYLTIPRLSTDVALVGLNCPYNRDPENMNCTYGAMIQSFIDEIKRRQPNGPYHLGGWSSGGAFAYMVAEMLVNQGDEVESLIVIDAPAPITTMEKLPLEFYEFCNSLGLFPKQPGATGNGSGSPPSYLIPHFIRVVDVTLDYRSAPLHTKRMPKLGLLWAADTVLDEVDAPQMTGMHFMVQKRSNFGPDGWDTLLPAAEYDIVRASGANHFTLMRQPHVNLVKEMIDRVVGTAHSESWPKSGT